MADRSVVTMFLWAFLVGGGLAALAQMVVDRTPLLPAHVMVLFVVAGVVAGGVGLYEPLVKLAGAGATVPLPGFGYTMIEGIGKAVRTEGFLGLLNGGLTAAAAGIKSVVLFGLAASLAFSPRS
jgi:stage V sporulation protein AE